MKRGKITLITGPMFSGKPSELHERAKWAMLSGASVVFLVPAVDTRAAGMSHDAMQIHTVVAVENLHDDSVAGEADFVFVDEGQFLAGLSAFCVRQRAYGRTVCVAALASDSDGRAWPEISQLALAHTDEWVQRKGVCVACREPAMYSRRLDGAAASALDLGGDEKYAPVCYVHFAPAFRLTPDHLQRRAAAVERVRKSLYKSV